MSIQTNILNDATQLNDLKIREVIKRLRQLLLQRQQMRAARRKPPVQRRQCPECGGDGCYSTPLMTRMKCPICKGTGSVEEPK